MPLDEFAEFDDLVRLVKAGAPPDALHAGATRAADEFRNRRYLYAWVYGRARGLPTYTHMSEPARPVGLLSLKRHLLLCLGLGLAAIAALRFGMYVGGGTAAAVVVAIAAWQLGADRARRRRANARVCLACGHSQVGLPVEFDVLPLVGEDWGPSLCSKCGRPWPLIPLRDGSPSQG